MLGFYVHASTSVMLWMSRPSCGNPRAPVKGLREFIWSVTKMVVVCHRCPQDTTLLCDARSLGKASGSFGPISCTMHKLSQAACLRPQKLPTHGRQLLLISWGAPGLHTPAQTCL